MDIRFALFLAEKVHNAQALLEELGLEKIKEPEQPIQ
jgi:hypothetical protein